MCLQILFIGDIVGRPGRECVRQVLPGIKKEYSIDLVIANGENAAGGMGITAPVLSELKEMGIDVITGGNHIWDKKEVFDFIDSEPGLLRPANYPAGTPGRGWTVVEVKGTSVAVLNLVGRIFMPPLDCPFRRAKEEVDKLRDIAKIIIVDFHAEATSEKQALGWHLDGRVHGVIGTHTHVQTADERLLPGGTAYITDVGMTGLHDSILGMDREPALYRFTTGLPARMNISRGRSQFNAVVLGFEMDTFKTRFIKRLSFLYPE